MTGAMARRTRQAANVLMVIGVALICSCCRAKDIGSNVQPQCSTTAGARMEWIRPSKDGRGFICHESGAGFVAWGFNYDHDAADRLLEDYWEEEWGTVVEDFQEMKTLGANVVRVHLQVGRFMKAPRHPNPAALEQLARLVRLAEDTGLYLDITGLGCYRKQDVPEWYNTLSEADRWDAQCVFWSAVAKVCADSPAVFCYDLMNEPILPGSDRKETEWLAGEFGGMNFVQRLTLDLAGRTREQVVRNWVERLVAAIRAYDTRHMITVGEIPWALVFPGAKPIFSKETGEGLDFVSVHFYPRKGEVDKALAALAVYDFGKPLIVEEMFPLNCSTEELDAFIDGSRKIADGWLGFYWGKTMEDYSINNVDAGGMVTRQWLELFRAKTPEILDVDSPTANQTLQRPPGTRVGEIGR
jgi:hypothetical protein